jgi:hypothetical protein
MTNTLGQGAGMAFEDAIVLSRALSSSLDPSRRCARSRSAAWREPIRVRADLQAQLDLGAGDAGQGVVPQQRQDPHRVQVALAAAYEQWLADVDQQYKPF